MLLAGIRVVSVVYVKHPYMILSVQSIALVAVIYRHNSNGHLLFVFSSYPFPFEGAGCTKPIIYMPFKDLDYHWKQTSFKCTQLHLKL